MSATPTTMQVLAVNEANGPFVRVERDVPVPAAGEVLVRVMASGVNPLDTKIRAGKGGHARHPFPAVLGLDLAGVVEAVGASVTAFKPGDEVYGMTGGVAGVQGSLAEYAAVDARLLAHKPRNLSMREAAALPLIAITAWEGLVDRAKVHAGQTVLIQGGTGGVGHVAVQIAKAHGATVYATVSEPHLELARSLGATPIDYRKHAVEDYVTELTDGEGFDIVYDTVGGATLDASFQAARVYEGHVLSCLGWGEHKLAPLSFRGATYSGVFTLLPLLTGKHRAHHGEILREVTRLVEAGQIKPLLDPRTFTLDTVAEAHAVVEAGKTAGKIVVEVSHA